MGLAGLDSRGRTYHVRAVASRIPKEGFPKDGGTIVISEPGEHVVRYRIQRDSRDNRWYGKLVTRGASVGQDEHRWVHWGSRTATTEGVSTSVQVFDRDDRVILARHRVSQATSPQGIEEPSAGFLIWLEPTN